MPRNNRLRSSPENSFPLKAIVQIVVAAIVAGGAGLTFVQYRNRSITSSGREIRRLEKELADLNNELETLRPRISQLASRTALQARLNDGFIKMVPIKQDRIVQMSLARETPMRTVANVSTQ